MTFIAYLKYILDISLNKSWLKFNCHFKPEKQIIYRTPDPKKAYDYHQNVHKNGPNYSDAPKHDDKWSDKKEPYTYADFEYGASRKNPEKPPERRGGYTGMIFK